MATQTGSIDLTATNGVKLYAKAGFDSAEKTYATKSELEVTNDAVALRATKTEASQMAQPNLSPFFSMAPTNVYNGTTNPDGYWDNSKASGWVNSVEQLADGWAHIDFSNTGTSTTWLTIFEHCAWRHKAGDLKGSTKYTVMFEFRKVTKSGNVTCIGTTQHATSWPSMFIGNSEQGNVAVADGVQYHIGTTVADPTSVTGSCCTTRTLIAFPAGSSLDAEFRVSLYEGEYAGPYKPYSGDMIYATNSELKVTADGISTEVAKKVNGTEIISAINQSAESVTISADKVNITGDAVFSAINNDTGTTKISGGKIDAESITIGGSSLATQADVDSIEVGGRNLVLGTSFDTPDAYTKTADGSHVVRRYELSEYASSAIRSGAKVTVTFEGKVSAGSHPMQVYIGYYNGDTATTIINGGSPLPTFTTEWTKLSRTLDFDSSLAPTWIQVTANTSTGSNGTTYSIRGMKLELGNKATDWSPAPEDQTAYVDNSVDSIQIGGKNLLLWTGEGETYSDHQGTSRLWDYTTIYGIRAINGNTAVFTKNSDGLTNNTSGLRVMSLTESGGVASSSANYGQSTQYGIDFKIGEQYTFSCDVKTDGNRVGLSMQYYNGTSVWKDVGIGEFVPADTDWHRYSFTFTIPNDFVCITALGVYCQLLEGVKLELKNIKLERGTKPTDWTPAPEDTDSAISTKLDASYNRIWYAECSTVAATTAKVATITPATTEFTLVKGQTVNVLFTATNTGAVGSLTLNVNNTGAKAIKYLSNGALANLPAANYLRINQIVTFTYDGNYWVTDFSYNSDTYNRTRWQGAIKVLAKPTGTWRLLCGTASGYRQIAAGVAFDLSYPILAVSAQPEANTTTDTGYLSINALTFSNTAAIQSGAANKTIYLKGVVSGNTFTIDGTNVFTTVIPTSEDGRCYIPLGIMTSATAGYFKSSKDLYAYVDGAFGPVSIREASAAAKTATNYLTHVDNDGLMVHDANAPTTGVKITDSVDILRSGVSVSNYGVNTRVGPLAGSHILLGVSELAQSSIEFKHGDTFAGAILANADTDLDIYDSSFNLAGEEDYVSLYGKRSYTDDLLSHRIRLLATTPGFDPDYSDNDLQLRKYARVEGLVEETETDVYESSLTFAAQKVSIYDPNVISVTHKLLQLGKPTSLYSTGNVSVANSSWVSVANLTIPSTGTWLVVVTGDFAANATGRRVMACTRNAAPSSTPAYDSQNSLTMAPVNGAPTKFSSSAIIDFDADDVYYAGVWQNSGSALTTRIMIKAVRLI